MVEKASSLQMALHDVADQLQILLWRRETTPIRDREEVKMDLQLRIQQLDGSSRLQWRKRMVEMAAYVLLAAISDESEYGSSL